MNTFFIKAKGFRLLTVSLVVTLFVLGAFLVSKTSNAEDATATVTTDVTVPADTSTTTTTDTTVVTPPATDTTVSAPDITATTPPTNTTTTTDTTPTANTTTIQTSNVIPATTSTNPSTLTTDKPDYEPGETVSIFGKFFNSLQNVVVRIFGNSEVGNHYSDVSYNVTADATGSFSLSNTLDNFYRPVYNVVASAIDGTELASMTFTDAAGASVDVYSQCANDDGDGYTGNPGVCDWTNGDLNGSNSTYTEEDSTVQRLAMSGLANGPHTVVIEYQTTKGGKHAYDFLTNDTASEIWVSATDICSGPVLGVLPTCALISPVPSGAVPHDSLNTLGTVDTDQHFKIRNGTFVVIGTPALVSGSYGADSLTDIAVTFNVDTNTCASVATDNKGVKTCPVFITWGAHVSSQADWGSGSSAVNISGSPYHVKVVELDGASTGNRDNQMAASAIVVPNTITVHKLTIGGDSTFTFTGTPSGSITTSGGTGTTLTANPPSGAGSVTESALSGWALTNLSCTVSGGATQSTNLATRVANYTMPTAGGGIVDCTFTNTLQQAHLTLVKTVTNDNGGVATAGQWTLAASGATSISGATTTASVTNAAVNAGVYTLSENSGPLGYTASTYSCVKNGGGAVVSNSITLAAGDSATCTINNNDNAPALHLRKVVVNDNGGAATVANFTLTANGAGANDISGTSPVDSGPGLLADTFALSETSVTGYTASAWVCVDGTQNNSNITLALGESATCTITNDDIAPTLKLVKTVTNNNGGTNQPVDWTLTTTGSGGFSDAGNSTTFHPVTAGVNYTLSESSIPGYTAGNWSCDGGTQSTNHIQLAVGQTGVTCTINNDDQAAHLIVIKHVINDNGGSAVASGFSTTISSVTTATPTAAGVESPGVDNVLTSVGSYSVDEGAHVGYAKTLSADCSGTIALGQTKTCTITNDDIQPKLTLTKVVVNDNGGNAVVADFPLFVSATGVTSGVQNGFNAGAYTASETNLAGYTAGNWGGDCATNGAITLNPGDVKACTITNDDQPAHIILNKVVINNNGGNAGINDFSLTVGGSAVNSGDNSAVNSNVAIALNEAGLTGYNFVSLTGDAKCPAVLGGTVTLNEGETVTCTITNDDIQPKLTVTKVVINHGGNKVVADFPLFVDATGVTSGVQNGFNAGAHVVSETGNADYTETITGDCAANGSITLALADVKACTITNEEKPAKVVVHKIVINHGLSNDETHFAPYKVGTTTVVLDSETVMDSGSYVVSEATDANYNATFTAGDCDASGNITLLPGTTKSCTITNEEIPTHLKVTKIVTNHGGNKVVADFPLFIDAGGVTSGVNNLVNSGAHTVSETGSTDYTETITGDCASNGTITLASGESKECTITNEEKPAKLIVTKVVVNDNGGTKVVADFPLFVDAAGVTSGDTNTFDSGAHTVSETSQTGYTMTGITGDCAANGTVTLVPGVTKSCTITNDDIAPKLHLRKVIVNDNGGTATVADFPLSANGTGANDLSGTTPADSGATLQADTFALSETSLAGYSASAWVCVGGNQVGSNITVGINEEATCTITNNDIPAHLIVIKHVINDNGGSAVASGFSTTISSVTTATPTAAGVESPGVDNVLTSVGSYSVDEGAHVGYDKTLDSGCSGTIALGETKTCTITNNDIAPKLHLRKIVVNNNGGTALNTAWTLGADGAGSNDLSGTTPVDSGAGLLADTFALSESGGPSGYTASAWSCVGGTQNGSNVTVGIGGEATCTITNDDIAPHLIVIKHVINDDGDVAVAGDFTMNITGTNVSNSSSAGAEAPGTDHTLNAGSYSVDEALNNGYVKTLSADCSGIIAVGETKTCTITNNDIPHATRTLGFWQTHTTYTSGVFGGFGGTLQIGTKVISDTAKLFGGFYASIPKMTVGGNRTALDKARMQMLQQWLAAELNCEEFSCSAATQTLLTNAATAWAGTNVSLILSYVGQLDTYNNSNDALPISGQGKATPKDSSGQANLVFWNVLS